MPAEKGDRMVSCCGARMWLGLALALLAIGGLAGCEPGPPAAAPTTPTTTPQPIVAAQPTAVPTQAAPPTAAPPAATAEARPTETQPDTTTHPSVGYLVYQRPDGSLWRADGPGAQPIRLTEPTDPEALLPWAASPVGQTLA